MEDSKDKPVTPTTINNYVRLKVMPAPEKRKYTGYTSPFSL